MDEKSAKKVYAKMLKDQMLPENFSGVWLKDKSKFLIQMKLNSKIGLDFQEYADGLEEDNDEYEY